MADLAPIGKGAHLLSIAGKKRRFRDTDDEDEDEDNNGNNSHDRELSVAERRETELQTCHFCEHDPQGQQMAQDRACDYTKLPSGHVIEWKNCADHRSENPNLEHNCGPPLVPLDGAHVWRQYSKHDPLEYTTRSCDQCLGSRQAHQCNVDASLKYGCTLTEACARDDVCLSCLFHNSACLNGGRLVAEPPQPTLSNSWSVTLGNEFGLVDCKRDSGDRRMCARCLKDERGLCLVDPDAYDSACSRCAQLGIDCININNGTRYPIVHLAKVGFGPHIPYIRCSCCARESRNCDLQRPCDSCVHHGEQCDPWEANTACFNGRLEPAPGPLYYLALGYGGRDVDDPKDGLSLEHWIGPLTNIFDLPPGKMKDCRWPTANFMVSLRSALLPPGQPLPGIASKNFDMYGPLSGTTKQLIALWVEAGCPHALPPACYAHYAGLVHAARGFKQNLVAGVSHQDQLEQAPDTSRPPVRRLTGKEPARRDTASPSGSRAPIADVLASSVPGPAPILGTTLAWDHDLAADFDLGSPWWQDLDLHLNHNAAVSSGPETAVVRFTPDNAAEMYSPPDPGEWAGGSMLSCLDKGKNIYVNLEGDASFNAAAAELFPYEVDNGLPTGPLNPLLPDASSDMARQALIQHDERNHVCSQTPVPSIEHDPQPPVDGTTNTDIQKASGDLYSANVHESLNSRLSLPDISPQVDEPRPVDDNPLNSSTKSGAKATDFRCSEKWGRRICNNPVPQHFTCQCPDHGQHPAYVCNACNSKSVRQLHDNKSFLFRPSLINGMRSYLCHSCAKEISEDARSVWKKGFPDNINIWGRCNQFSDSSDVPSQITTPRGSITFMGNAREITGCMCEEKLIGYRLCHTHRFQLNRGIRNQAREILKKSKEFYGSTVCFTCDQPLERDGNVRNPNGPECVSWFCFGCGSLVMNQPNKGIVLCQRAGEADEGQDDTELEEDDVEEIPEAEVWREPSEAPSRGERSVGRYVRETSLGHFMRAPSFPQTGREPNIGPRGNQDIQPFGPPFARF